jgi:5-formyltetrahydrofolate cyclo-ligase
VPDGTAVVRPEALLIPAVGIGPAGDRLGYGGGFFDRTLAALDPKPIAVGIAFELSRISTTQPQAHDVLMDFVVTEAGIDAPVRGGLERIAANDCQRRVAELAADRGLPRRSRGADKV